MLTRLKVGSDVSASWFHVGYFLKKEKVVRIYKNNPGGYAQFIKEVQELAKKIFICMEHTGGYESALARACHEAGFIVSLVDGALIANYRKSFGSAKSKTDSADALLLANFLKERQPARWFPIPDEYQQLKDLVKLREDLVELKGRISSQSSHPTSLEYIRNVQQALLDLIEADLKATEEEIEAHVKACSKLKEQIKLLVSIPGIGFVSAVRILAETGPISNYSTAKDYALAAGLVPISFQSGKKTPPGKLPVYGNKRLRCALYFPAIVNRRSKVGIGAFMIRVNGNGNKVKMTVITAGMRKIAHVVFGVLKSQTKYNPELT